MVSNGKKSGLPDRVVCAGRRAYPLDHIQGGVSSSVVADHKLVDAIGVRHLERGEVMTLQAAGRASHVYKTSPS